MLGKLWELERQLRRALHCSGKEGHMKHERFAGLPTPLLSPLLLAGVGPDDPLTEVALRL
eukprot:11610960-Alexandrium_andersonii.AAC.1